MRGEVMARSFSTSDKAAAYERASGHCEHCTAPLMAGHYQYDHIKPYGLGGISELANCRVLCTNCHSEKTHKVDRPPMQKADNIKRKHIGAKTRRPWHPNLRKKVSGKVEPK
jgi:5-methylcytosine-specific restriction endonuclease McrA